METRIEKEGEKGEIATTFTSTQTARKYLHELERHLLPVTTYSTFRAIKRSKELLELLQNMWNARERFENVVALTPFPDVFIYFLSLLLEL